MVSAIADKYILKDRLDIVLLEAALQTPGPHRKASLVD
jgi:hypothetical protein